VLSARRKLAEIKKLPSGKDDNADRKYEDSVCQLMASLLYPHLDFAAEQSRTDSGVLIRDLIFYNNRSYEFLKELFDDYGSRQLVMELKNVSAVTREHMNQLNRYMTDDLGKFGVLITRQELAKPRMQNTIDLWSGQRRCIITLTDLDLEQMVEVFESKQRLPLDVLKKKYVQFRRACPA
jgi:DNA topoisomerase VI subunit A